MLTPDADEERRYQQLQAQDGRAEGAADAFIAALYDPSWRVRRRAAERLAERQSERQSERVTDETIPRLVDVLSHRGETGARNAAAEALVAIGAPAVPALVTLLAHPDPDQRKFAADILGLIGASGVRSPDEAGAALVAAVEDPDPNVRVSAAEALGHVGGPQAPRALERALTREEPLLQLAAVEALTRLNAPPPLPVLVRLLETPALRRVCIRALGLVRQPAAVREVVRALWDDSRTVAEASLAGLGISLRSADAARVSEMEVDTGREVRRAPATFLAHLQTALTSSEDVEARRGALFCLSLLGDASLAPQVAEAAEDDRLAEDVLAALLRMGPLAARTLAQRAETLGGPARLVAADAISRRADASAIPELHALVSSSEPELQLAAITALGRTASRDALAPLSAALEDPSLAPRATRALLELSSSCPGDVRDVLREAAQVRQIPSALQALAQLEGHDAMGTLRGAARNADPALRAAAAKAAGEVGGHGATELLRVGLSDESAEVRVAAARALGRAPSDEVSSLLRRLLHDADPDIQVAALEAAAESGSVALVPRLRELASGDDAGLSIRALKALARMGRLDGEALMQASRHPEPEVVREALVLGAALPEGVVLARRFLCHERWELRAAAARVLGVSGGPSELPFVMGALSREQDALVREALEQARAQLGRR